MTDLGEVRIIGSEQSTSSGESIVTRSLRVIWIAGALSIGLGGTHSAGASEIDPFCEIASQTNSGVNADQKAAVGSAIMELRRLSGLTWEQLAGLFEVSRRTVHFWASGKALSAYNEEKLYRILATVQQIDRGTAHENRDCLFNPQAGGVVPIDLLRDGRYSEVVQLVGASTYDRPTRASLSERALAMRMPQPPEALVGALHDRVEVRAGRTRPVKTVRIKNNKKFDNT